MHIPWENKIETYFCLIEEIKANWKVYDTHLHPVEVIFNNMSYQKNIKEDGIFSLNKSQYTQPSLINIIEKHKSSKDLTAFIRSRPQLLQMILQNIYTHTGPKVFRNCFSLNFIDKGLMLPVAPEVGTTKQLMDLCHTMFKDDDCFSLAGSVPNTVSNQDVESFLKKESEKYKIIAVKVHPNITGIDLGIREGKERLEAIISAGSRLRLPVIVHAGCSRLFLNNRRAEFSSLFNFKDINFDVQTPVVLSHGGAYELACEEVNRDVLPLLIKLLKKFSNLLIDIAMLNHDVIKLLLTKIPIEKILFGSDALYQNQSLMLMNLIYALESSSLKLDESLINILSKNPGSKIFKEAPNK